MRWLLAVVTGQYVVCVRQQSMLQQKNSRDLVFRRIGPPTIAYPRVRQQSILQSNRDVLENVSCAPAIDDTIMTVV